MIAISIQIFGALAFFLGTLVIGDRIRRSPTIANAEQLSRVSHALFWLGLVLPEFLGGITPGLTSFDRLLQIPSLPSHAGVKITGWVLLTLSLYYLGMSNLALKTDGRGFAAFKLTRRVVARSVYDQIRNPMSLGCYLAYLGVSLIAGSTYLLAGTIVVIIPVHLFNLIFFEAHELRARYAQSYPQYAARVPFIIPRLFRARA